METHDELTLRLALQRAREQESRDIANPPPASHEIAAVLRRAALDNMARALR